MMEWPIGLAESLQWTVAHENLTDVEPLLQLFRQQKQFLSLQFLELFLPQQPGLMATVTLTAIFSAILFVLFLGFVVARSMGQLGAELYQKQKSSISKFGFLSAAFVVHWVLFLFLLLFLINCILSLGSNRNGISATAEVPLDFRPSNVGFWFFFGFFQRSVDGPVRISLNSISITDVQHRQLQPFGEADLLNKYNGIRELGYEFKPMETDGDFRLQIVIFSTVVSFYVILLIISTIMMIVGSREYLNSYHPVDRSRTSNICGRALIAVSHGLLGSVPFLLLLSTFLLIYIQSYNDVCPFVQTQTQNENMQSYVNTNFQLFDPYNLFDFLNDLSAERSEINRSNCRGSIRSLQGIWMGIIFVSITAIPTAVILLRITKYFLRMSPKYYWNPPDAYESQEKQFAEFRRTMPRY